MRIPIKPSKPEPQPTLRALIIDSIGIILTAIIGTAFAIGISLLW